ncbi:MAG TPA: anti-sigma factor antagonist [Pseudonocardiaceae bacterium]|nr:anti-sigma factor antagonist [Pseudonocardiaceae bacterium]
MKPAGDERTPDGRAQAAPGPGREQLLSVAFDDRGDALVVAVSGEVDGLTAPRLRAALRDAFDRLSGRILVLDLADVEFLGSAGLRTLLDSAREAMGHPGYQPLRVVVDSNRPVVRSIEIVGLDNVLALYDSVPDALAV